MRFDRVVIVDWSASGVPKVGQDSIWIGVADAAGVRSENIRTRLLAERRLLALMQAAMSTGERLLIGTDFNHGAPAGLARHLTGQARALALWGWLAARMTDDAANRTTYRAVAAAINATLPGDGPFWGNGARADVPGLPRRKPALPPGLSEHRATDLAGRSDGLVPKPIWQLAGAGAVGAQSLTGIAVLERLRQTLGPACAVWPFQPRRAPVVLAEVYASHLAPQVARRVAGGQVRDRAQVELLAGALLRLSQDGTLGPLFRAPLPPAILHDEGWTLGTGHLWALRAASDR